MNDIQRVENVFEGSGRQVSTVETAQAATDQARSIAEVQAALVIARANPRDEKASMDRILTACTRHSLAASAVYSYTRGRQEVSGPSIRLAEALAQNWGNIQYGLREIAQTSKESTVQAYAWDLETNTRREIVFQVPLKRDTRGGTYTLTDSRDIYEHVANQGARRLRTCILSLIPGDVVESAVRQCQLTLQASVDMSPQNLKATLQAFAQYGVTKPMIEERFGRRFESINPGQMVLLRTIYCSLRDGMGTAADYFHVGAATTAEEETAPNQSLKDKLGITKRKAKGPQPIPGIAQGEPEPVPNPPEQAVELNSNTVAPGETEIVPDAK